MNKVFIIIIILFLAIGSILVVQAMQTSTSLVFTPSELVTKDKESYLPRVRVAGKVAAEKLDYQLEPKIKLNFFVLDPEGSRTEKLKVSYDKLMPDMFAPGRSVIIDGEYKNGTLYAKSLLTQCPSKYEPPTPIEQ